MTKEELVKEIAKQTGMEILPVEIIVETFMKSVKENLLKQKSIQLRGFGTFKLKKRAAKPARIIHKNTAIVIPEHFIPAFKPARKFSDKVKKNAV
jgi:DNA-binding protein HU-beta